MPKGVSGNISGKNEKHLTAKQIRFAKEVVFNDGSKTQTECALSAGYADGSAAVRACELVNPQKFPLVVRGLYIERKEVRTGTLDSLSEIEIKERIKKLLGDYKPLLEVEDAQIISS